jgi:hypothetical protein
MKIQSPKSRPLFVDLTGIFIIQSLYDLICEVVFWIFQEQIATRIMTQDIIEIQLAVISFQVIGHAVQ